MKKALSSERDIHNIHVSTIMTSINRNNQLNYSELAAMAEKATDELVRWVFPNDALNHITSSKINKIPCINSMAKFIT